MSWLQVVTVFGYVFVIIAYTIKVRKYFKMPHNLRWDIYPIPHEEGYRYGGSYFEEPEFWKKPRKVNRIRDILEMVKQYLTLWGYFRRMPLYWLGILPWHIGFYSIIAFHGFLWITAIAIKVSGIEVAAISPSVFGVILYYVTLVLALMSFFLGTFGSIVLLGERSFHRDLRNYAAPQNYFNYIFCLVLFVSGIVSWVLGDGTFAGYREFWVSIFSVNYAVLPPIEAVHVLLFALFLIYLPFTRSTHYITLPIAYFKIRWSDSPNYGGENQDAQLVNALSRKNNWSAPHIQTGENWGETVTKVPKK